MAVTIPIPANTSAQDAKFVKAPASVTTISSKMSTIAPPRPVAKPLAASTTVPTIAPVRVAPVSIVQNHPFVLNFFMFHGLKD